jgi:hypothetical protein
MAIQVILNQAGPLPITVDFEAPGDGPMNLEVNGSVWTQTPNAMTAIVVELNSSPLGAALIYSNGNATHRTVVPGYFAVEFSGEGTNTLTLSAADMAVSDANDWYTAVIHY